jgi:tetratricopeptide (TPR) repeat protein
MSKSVWGQLRQALAASAITLAACSSPLKQGDTARSRGDWDAAVSSYEQALRSASNPGEIGAIKQRLSEAKARAAEDHVAAADRAETLHDRKGLLQNLRRAYELEPTDAIKARLEKAQQEEAAQCFLEGRVSMEQGRYGEAVDRLARAVEMGAGADATELLAQARTEDERAREAQYVSRVDEARRRLAARDWAGASAQYELAHAAAKHDDSMREAAFATHMARAEVSAARGDPASIAAACREFRTAAEFGIDGDHVNGRIAATEPVDLVINVLGAVILPFKPVSGKPWDGFGGGRDVSGVTKQLGMLMEASPQALLATEVLAPLIASGTEPPDCFVTITVGDRSFGGIGSTCMNSYTPRWNVGVVLSNTTASDGRTITIAVSDKDLEQDDPVGTIHTPIAELVRRAEAGPMRFVDKEWNLQAGGIVQLDVSVERRPPGTMNR